MGVSSVRARRMLEVITNTDSCFMNIHQNTYFCELQSNTTPNFGCHLITLGVFVE